MNRYMWSAYMWTGDDLCCKRSVLYCQSQKKRPDVAAEIPQWAAGIRIAAIMAVEPLAGVREL